LKIEQWLTEQLGKDIWDNKYRFKTESFDEWVDRVSAGNEETKRLIYEKKFLFGGRTLSNRKTGKNASYSNCYSSGYAPDSLLGIMELNTNLAMTYKSQGGQGLSLSKIRPKGTDINGQFESDGILPFMRIFNITTESVSQGGSRKGALLMSLACDHKEINEFISIKTKDNSINKANLSVEFDDEFMLAVKKFYETGEKTVLDITKKYEGKSITYKITPIDIYKNFANSSYNWAEPGAIMTNRFRNYNLMEFIVEYEIVTGNPCFTGDMELLTKEGYKTLSELEDKEVQIINPDGNTSEGKVWCSGEKDIIQLTLSNKKRIKCTPDHVFMLNNNNESQAKDTLKQRLTSYYGETNLSEDIFVQLGFIQGDGCVGRINSEHHLGLEVNIGDKDDEILDLFEVSKVEGKRAYYINGYNDLLVQYGFDGSVLPERVFPITYTSWMKFQRANFLKGCYSANGCVIKTHRVSYKTTSKVFSLQLKKALEEFGITAYITTNKPTMVKFSNGDYLCKESYDVNISRLTDIITFYQSIGFMQQYKIHDLVDLIKIKSPKVTSIKKLPKEKVYDFSEPLTHWGVVEGVVVHNCGEQPLPKDGACNLGSMNFSAYVVNPYTKESYFDDDAFSEDVRVAIESLDNVLDEGKLLHALESQRQMANDYRNVGLGIMGLGDMFIKLGMKYGSEESKQILDVIMFEMFRSAVWKSAELAIEKGCFPKYSEKVFDSTIIKDHFDEEEIDTLKKKGLRNCSLLSIAPSGSIGTMLDITTGIEPCFSLSYQRKTESLHKDKEVSYTVFMSSAKEYMELYNTEVLPDYFVTSNDIPWKDRIDIQSIAQNHVDTAISSTVNLPESATLEEVEQLYLYAWEKKLKGVTIFRDNCARLGILTKPTVEKKAIETVLDRGFVTKAPSEAEGKTYKFVSGCGNAYVGVTWDETGKINQTFTNKGSSGTCRSNQEAVSRLVSLALRGGIPIEKIIDQLESVDICPSYISARAKGKPVSKGVSCPHAIANILKQAIKDVGVKFENVDKILQTKTVVVEEVADNSRLCPECKESLINEGGCIQCKSCGYSKCN